MRTWLFIWNQANFPWDDPIDGYHELANDIEQCGTAYGKWSCGVNKSIKRGDRIFLIRLGSEPRGIVASGHAMTDVFEGTHWNPEMVRAGKKARRIYIEFDKIVNYQSTGMIPYNVLKTISSEFHWSPQASGVSIPDDIAEKLEEIWKNTSEIRECHA